MPSLYQYPFQPLDSSTPSFNSTAGNQIAIEATGREFKHPTSRTVRLSSIGTDDYYVLFGSSTQTFAAVGTAMQVLGGVSEVFRITPKQQYMSIASSTDVTVNVTLGTGF